MNYARITALHTKGRIGFFNDFLYLSFKITKLLINKYNLLRGLINLIWGNSELKKLKLINSLTYLYRLETERSRDLHTYILDIIEETLITLLCDLLQNRRFKGSKYTKMRLGGIR